MQFHSHNPASTPGEVRSIIWSASCPRGATVWAFYAAHKFQTSTSWSAILGQISKSDSKPQLLTPNAKRSKKRRGGSPLVKIVLYRGWIPLAAEEDTCGVRDYGVTPGFSRQRRRIKWGWWRVWRLNWERIFVRHSVWKSIDEEGHRL